MKEDEHSAQSFDLITKAVPEMKLWQESQQESQSTHSKSSKHSEVAVTLWQESVKTPSSPDSKLDSSDEYDNISEDSTFIELLKVEVPKKGQALDVKTPPVKSITFKSAPKKLSPVKAVTVKTTSPTKRSALEVNMSTKRIVLMQSNNSFPQKSSPLRSFPRKRIKQIDNDPTNPENDPNCELFAGDPEFLYAVLPENNPLSDEFRFRALPLKLPKNYKTKLPVGTIEYRYTCLGQLLPDYDERGYRSKHHGLGSKYWTPSIIGNREKLERQCEKAKKKEEQDIYKKARTPVKITPIKDVKSSKNDIELLLSHFGGELLPEQLPTWNQNSMWKNTRTTCPLGMTEECDICLKLLFSNKLRSKPFKNLNWFQARDSTSPYFVQENPSIRHALVKNMLPKEIRLRSISRKAILEALLTRFRGYTYAYDLNDVIDEVFHYKHWTSLDGFLNWKNEWDHKFELEDYGTDNSNYYCTGCGVRCIAFYNSVGDRIQKCRTGFCAFVHNESYKNAKVKGDN